MRRGERGDGIRVACRQRADQHALDARGERRLDLLGRAEAAADLQPDAAPGGQAREHGGVLGAALAVARGVEIDHVQPAGAGQGEAIRGLVGRLVEAGDAPVVALQQAHDAPAGEIHGRNDFHCHVTMLTCRLVNSSAQIRPEWRDDSVDELLRAFGLLRSDEERAAFLRDLCTLAEIQAMAHRLAAARLVDKGVPYAEVAERVGGSTTTVTRVAHWLRHGEGGYRLVLDRLARRRK